jgi:hypothetical protein
VPTFGGNFLADFGSEGDNPGSQLFYVPTGADDPIFSGDEDFLADLDTFISNDGCLKDKRGTIIGRNACQTDWINVVSVRFMQEISLGRASFDLMLDIENFGNLLNSDWGRVDSYTAPSNVAPVILGGLTEDGQSYIVSPNASYVPGDPSTIVPDPEIAALPSVYRIQVGVRFRF